MSTQPTQERMSQHLTLLVGNLEKLMERSPRSSQELDELRIFADATLLVALEVVCELLPSELQPTVKRLVELRQALWAHSVVTGQEEGTHEQ